MPRGGLQPEVFKGVVGGRGDPAIGEIALALELMLHRTWTWRGPGRDVRRHRAEPEEKLSEGRAAYRSRVPVVGNCWAIGCYVRAALEGRFGTRCC